MIRVFILALLAFAALVMVARNLRGHAPEPTEMIEQVAQDESSPFARWDGAWEGTFNTRRPDGTLESSLQVHQEYTTITPTEQSVTITDRHADGSIKESRGQNTEVNGSLECRLWEPDGTMKLLTGTRAGRALFWHRRDTVAGIEETFREEIVRDAGGDLYTIDGVGLYGKSRTEVLLYEGRYRRVDRAGD